MNIVQNHKQLSSVSDQTQWKQTEIVKSKTTNRCVFKQVLKIEIEVQVLNSATYGQVVETIFKLQFWRMHKGIENRGIAINISTGYDFNFDGQKNINMVEKDPTKVPLVTRQILLVILHSTCSQCKDLSNGVTPRKHEDPLTVRYTVMLFWTRWRRGTSFFVH